MRFRAVTAAILGLILCFGVSACSEEDETANKPLADLDETEFLTEQDAEQYTEEVDESNTLEQEEDFETLDIDSSESSEAEPELEEFDTTEEAEPEPEAESDEPQEAEVEPEAEAEEAPTGLGPALLLDADRLATLTLEDLCWSQTDEFDAAYSVHVVVGDFCGGPFQTLKPDFSVGTVNPDNPDYGLRERAAVFFPQGYPNSCPRPAVGKGLVVAMHRADLVPSSTDIVALVSTMLCLPVVLHGEYAQDWQDVDWNGRNDLVSATMLSAVFKNRCEVSDLQFGNFFLKLAEVNMRAMSLLARLAEQRGGSISEFGMVGSSKEGAACWYVSATDERLKVAGCRAFQFEDWLALHNYETDWACNGSAGGIDVGGSGLFYYWLVRTPAGDAYQNLLSVPRFVHLLKPWLFLLGGDVGMPGMHDGTYFPLGSETEFLLGFDKPFRYDRETGQEAESPRIVLPLYNVGDCLIRGPVCLSDHPKVRSVSIEQNDSGFSVVAEVEPAADVVSVFWNYSYDRRYNHEDQPEWQRVEMQTDDGQVWTSPLIQGPPEGAEAAVFVEALKEVQIGRKTFFKRDSSPIQFINRLPEHSCNLEIPDWCSEDK